MRRATVRLALITCAAVRSFIDSRALTRFTAFQALAAVVPIKIATPANSIKPRKIEVRAK